MSRPDQPLIIEPHTELKFKGPFTSAVSSYMKLTNPSDHKYCFKIKTTAPKKYCVRPNSGTIDAKSSIEIAVSLQPFDFDVNEKNKHKFMVQSISAPDGDFNIETLWREVDPGQIVDYKLKCVFENPTETATYESLPDTGSTYIEAKRVPELQSSSGHHYQDNDMVKTSADINNSSSSTREEESNLRQENLKLQEELLRLRLQQQNNQSSLSSGGSGNIGRGMEHKSGGGDTPELSFSMIIALTILTAIIGVIIGKFVL